MIHNHWIKSLCLSIGLIFLSVPLAYANAFYVAPSLSYDGFRADDIGWIGFTPKLAVGYGGLINEWIYLAAEIFGNPKPITKNNYPNDTQDIRPSYSYGMSLMPGVPLDSLLLLVVRLGVIRTNFSDYGQKTGYQLGGGLEAVLDNCWSIRGEYIYTRYNSISDLGKPHVDEYALSFIYRFL